MRKGKLRAASATGSRSSGNCTVTSRSLSTKLPKKFRAVSVNPLTIPMPNIILCPRSAYLRRHSSFAIGVDRSDRPFRGFLPRKTTPRDLYHAAVIGKCLSSTVHFSHDDINAPQDHHDIRDIVAEAHV